MFNSSDVRYQGEGGGGLCLSFHFPLWQDVVSCVG